MPEPDGLPWTGKDTTLARAMRAGLARADLTAQTIRSEAVDGSTPQARGMVMGGFNYDPEELHEYATAMGRAYTVALVENLLENMGAPSEEDAAAIGEHAVSARQVAFDQLLSGLENASCQGLFAGMFGQGVTVGELERREEERDNRRADGIRLKPELADPAYRHHLREHLKPVQGCEWCITARDILGE